MSQVNKTQTQVPLKVHRIKYSYWMIHPDEDSRIATAYVLAEDYAAAERLVFRSIPFGAKINVDERQDTILEIHGISEGLERALLAELKEKYQDEKPKLANRLLRK